MTSCPDAGNMTNGEARAVGTPRERLLMDFGWKFHRGEVPVAAEQAGWIKAGNFLHGPASPAFDDRSWRAVDLPHDFVVEGEFTRHSYRTAGEHRIPNIESVGLLHHGHGSLPGDVGWYRKTFLVDADDRGKRLGLILDGVYRNSQVWLNGYFVGRHLSGYTGACFDISEMVNYGDKNALAVRVDATDYEGWWYEGGGIYRHTWLTKTAPIHVAAWGPFVHSTVEDGGREARVTAETRVVNETDETADGQLLTTLFDPSGVEAAATTQAFSIRPGETALIAQTMTVRSPQLWSLEAPNLYRCVSRVCVGETNVDEYEAVFGIRTIRFDSQGFFLNDRPVKLKGMCCHQDHAGVGVAVPDAVQAYRMEQLKALGVNAYRCAHHPPSPELLDICDHMGILVIDENRLIGTSAEALAQLESMLLRDRNHPCIILWSLGNEEFALQNKEVSGRIAKVMQRLVRRLDPTRPTTYANNDSASWTQGITEVVDVAGFNYNAEQADRFHQERPDKPCVLTEAAAKASTRGIYRDDPDACHVLAYDTASPLHWGGTVEGAWTFAQARSFVAGLFYWSGFDYRGEPSPFSWPCVLSHFGLLDLCGFPKDTARYLQAWWTGAPVLHLYPHWNWPGREGETIRVWCYSNAEEVELFVNGRTLGRKPMPRHGHLEWDAAYAPGELAARGYAGGRVVAAASVPTTGAPARIVLTPSRTSVQADGADAVVVNVAVTDEAGRVAPLADNEIVYAITGPGRIAGLGNGDPTSHDPEQGRRRRVFNGWGQAIIQAGREPGEITLRAESRGLLSASLRLAAASCNPRPSVRAMADNQAESAKESNV